MLPGAPWGSGRGWRGHVLVVADDDAQLAVVQPRDRDLAIGESGGDQQRVVGPSSQPHLEGVVVADAHLRHGAHEAVEQLPRLGLFVSVADAPRQQAVQRRGQQRELQVDVNLERHRGRERVEMEEVDGFLDAVLDHHAAGVAVDKARGRLGVGMVGQQQGGLVVAEVGDGDLAQGHRAGAQADLGCKDAGVAIAAPDVVQLDALPVLGGGVAQGLEHLGGAAAEGEEADALGVQLGEHGVGGEAGVEDEFGGQRAGALAEGVNEAQDGFVLVALLDGGVGEAEQAVVGVAGEEGEDAVLAARALGDEVLFDEGFVAVEGDGVEVEVEGGAAGEGGEGLGGVEPAGGEGGDAAGVDAGGVLGEGGALGDGIEAGEEGEALVESVGHDAEGAADAPELEGEQGEGGAVGGDAVGAGEAGLLDERGEVELDEGGQEEEEAAEGGAEGAGCRRSHYFAKLGSHYFGGEKGGIVGLFVICYRRTKRGQFGVDTPGRGKGPFCGRSAPFEGPSCYPDCFGGRK